jgi:hypothetical protein
MSETTEVFSVLGLFDSAEALMQAIPKLRERRLGHLEAYTPYPVHGLDRALGQRRSPVGGMVFVMGLLGVATGLLFQWWVSAVDYPIVTGGKSPSSWQAFVPIMFEIMVLFAAFTAGLGMLLLLSRLPFFGHPVLRSRAIQGITRDRFALAVEPGREAGESARFDPEAARAALLAVGARDLETLPALERGPFLTAGSIQKSLAGIAVACLVAGAATYGAIKLTPVLSPVSHMLVQPRLDPQMESRFFKDGRGMRPPVPGTVARGFLPPGFHTQDEAAQPPAQHPRSAGPRQGRIPDPLRGLPRPPGQRHAHPDRRLRCQAGQPHGPQLPGLHRRADLRGHRAGQERHAVLCRGPARGCPLGGGPLRARAPAGAERQR